MTAYASEQDILDRYGEETLLLISDRDGDGSADPEVTARAVADAGAEIEAWLAARYSLPLAVVPEVLTRVAVDIAVYRLSAEADLLTEERRTRYEDAVKLLKALAEGKAALGIEDETGSEASAGMVWSSSRPRRFGR